jgi:hypothetical protein
MVSCETCQGGSCGWVARNLLRRPALVHQPANLGKQRRIDLQLAGASAIVLSTARNAPTTRAIHCPFFFSIVIMMRQKRWSRLEQSRFRDNQ